MFGTGRLATAALARLLLVSVRGRSSIKGVATG
jgi:hypothetical protein